MMPSTAKTCRKSVTGSGATPNERATQCRHQGSRIEAQCEDDLKSLSMPELKAKLGASLDGLSQAEAHKRLTQYGPNEIEEKEPNPYLKFLTYFWGPIRG